MRKIVLFILMLPVAAMCQKSEVITDSTKTKAQLYASSIEWIALKWKSANDVIQMKDPDAGVVVAKGGLVSVPRSVGIPAKGLTMSTVTIRVKEGKVKIEFSDTNFKWLSGPLWTLEEEPSAKKQWEKWKEACLAEQDELIADYKKHLSKSNDF